MFFSNLPFWEAITKFLEELEPFSEGIDNAYSVSFRVLGVCRFYELFQFATRAVPRARYNLRGHYT